MPLQGCLALAMTTSSSMSNGPSKPSSPPPRPPLPAVVLLQLASCQAGLSEGRSFVVLWEKLPDLMPLFLSRRGLGFPGVSEVSGTL